MHLWRDGHGNHIYELYYKGENGTVDIGYIVIRENPGGKHKWVHAVWVDPRWPTIFPVKFRGNSDTTYSKYIKMQMREMSKFATTHIN